jgi:hypothetical protein
MNTIVDLRANIYASDVDAKKMKVTPLMELVIVYSSGKEYIDTGNELASKDIYSDLRLMLNPSQLDKMIDALKQWKKTLANREDFWKEVLPGIKEPTNPKAK